MASSVALLIIGVVVVAGALLLSPSAGELQKVQHSPKEDGSLTVLAVGDWGRAGQYNQTLVAEQKGLLREAALPQLPEDAALKFLDGFFRKLGESSFSKKPFLEAKKKGAYNCQRKMGVVGEKLGADFMISTGDNFYNDGLAGDNDTAFFRASFSDIYTADSLQKPWYIVLGNHDYTGDALAQQSPAIRDVDARWTSVNKSFIVESGIVDFFLVDTSPFVLKYWNESKFDWRNVAPRDTYIANLIKDLEEALTASNATWKVVVGHHPISSGCEHGNTTELREYLLPVLKTHGVDMYLNGHDHCLQRTSSTDSPVEFVTSGGGSKAWAGKFKPTSDKMEFLYDGQGFLSMQITAADARFAFYDVAGEVLHAWELTKSPAAALTIVS